MRIMALVTSHLRVPDWSPITWAQVITPVIFSPWAQPTPGLPFHQIALTLSFELLYTYWVLQISSLQCRCSSLKNIKMWCWLLSKWWSVRCIRHWQAGKCHGFSSSCPVPLRMWDISTMENPVSEHSPHITVRDTIFSTQRWNVL